MNQYTFTPLCSTEDLRSMYCDRNMTQHEIASHFNVSLRRVQVNMRRAGIKARVAAKRNQVGPANSMWKGDAAGYQAVHLRVATIRGKPSLCAICGDKDAGGYEWANLTGNYHDINDYTRLCLSCHRKLDRAGDNFAGVVPLRRGGRVRSGGADCLP